MKLFHQEALMLSLILGKLLTFQLQLLLFRTRFNKAQTARHIQPYLPRHPPEMPLHDMMTTDTSSGNGLVWLFKVKNLGL